MQLKIFVLASLLGFALYANAQYYQYSQYNYADQRVNPGAISQSDFATASFVYRNQQSISDVQLSSFLFSAKYPFIGRNGGDRWSAVGITFGEDKAGLNGIFETNEFGLTYAINFATGEEGMLSIGTRLNYQSKRINIENLTTGNQFVPGVGFVRDIDSGENLNSNNTNFISASFGFIWEKKNKDGEKTLHFGASLFDFNRPDESLLGNGSSLPMTSVIEGGVRVYSKGPWSIYPEFLYTTSHSTNALNIGTVTSYKLDRFDSRLKDQAIDIHTKYLMNQGAILGVQWRRGPLSIGASYDIPINQRVANQGAFELGFQFGKLIETKYKPRKVKRRKRNKKKDKDSDIDNNSQSRFTKEKTSTKDNLVAKSEEEIDSLLIAQAKEPVETEDNELVNEENKENDNTKAHVGDFNHLRYNEPIFFNFNFNLDEAILKKEDEKILDDLVRLMKKNRLIKVDIQGHTDDIGDAHYNYMLSRKRAQAVARYLAKNGIDRKRIKHAGYGEERPLFENNNNANRAKNRRVEFVIYKD